MITIAKAVKSVMHCRAGSIQLTSNLVNISGSRAYNFSDFPYPVGRDTKVSLPSRKDRIASSCFNFNDAIPIMCGSRSRGNGVATPPPSPNRFSQNF